MGILGYPNMDDGNHDGAFGDYSDIYSNFSEEENTLAGSGEETFGDTASAGNSAVNETYAANQQNKPQEDTASTDFQNYSPAKQNDSSRLTIYLIVLGLVLVAAVGLFFYKKRPSPPPRRRRSTASRTRTSLRAACRWRSWPGGGWTPCGTAP